MSTYVLDGLNIIRANSRDHPCLERLLVVVRALLKRGVDVLCIFDANTRHVLREQQSQRHQEIYERILTKYPGTFVQVSSGPADPAILAEAERRSAVVISNDQYRQYELEYPWLRAEPRRVFGYQAIRDGVTLHDGEYLLVPGDVEQLAQDVEAFLDPRRPAQSPQPSVPRATAPSSETPAIPKPQASASPTRSGLKYIGWGFLLIWVGLASVVKMAENEDRQKRSQEEIEGLRSFAQRCERVVCPDGSCCDNPEFPQCTGTPGACCRRGFPVLCADMNGDGEGFCCPGDAPVCQLDGTGHERCGKPQPPPTGAGKQNSGQATSRGTRRCYHPPAPRLIPRDPEYARAPEYFKEACIAEGGTPGQRIVGEWVQMTCTCDSE